MTDYCICMKWSFDFFQGAIGLEYTKDLHID